MISIKISSHKSVRALNNNTSNSSKRMETIQRAEASGLGQNQQQTEQLVSQVEIKYQQPIAAKRLINNSNNGRKPVISGQKSGLLANQQQRPYQRPRGSLSSCSSSSPDLSGAGEDEDELEEEQYGAQLVPNQLGRLIKDANSGASWQANDRAAPAAPISRIEANKQQQQAVNKQPISGRVHTRSISLIVNPEFDSSDSDGSVFEVSTKTKTTTTTTTAPRTGRPQRVNYHHRRQRSGVRLASASEQAELIKALNLKQEAGKHELPDDCQQNRVASSAEPSKVDQRDENGECHLAQEDRDEAESDSSRLRQIGFVLRQISDEFSRNRRWTI